MQLIRSDTKDIHNRSYAWSLRHTGIPNSIPVINEHTMVTRSGTERCIPDIVICTLAHQTLLQCSMWCFKLHRSITLHFETLKTSASRGTQVSALCTSCTHGRISVHRVLLWACSVPVHTFCNCGDLRCEQNV